MQRVDDDPARVATDLFGPGKHGLKDDAPASRFKEDLSNAIVEELVACVEGPGSELDRNDLHQVSRQVLGHIERLAIANMIGNGGADNIDLRAIAHSTNPGGRGRGQFMAVGTDGRVRTSQAGVLWEDNTWPWEQVTINAVAWYDKLERWIAAGNNGRIGMSEDGVEWQKSVNVNTETLFGLATGNGYAVVCGVSGRLMTSDDGYNWTERSAGTEVDFRTACFDAETGYFFIAGNDGKAYRSKSSDLLFWQELELDLDDEDESIDIYASASHAGVTVLAGNGGKVHVSKDGLTFTTLVFDAVDFAAEGRPFFRAAAFARSGMMILLGDESEFESAPNRIFTSLDHGATWACHRQSNDSNEVKQRGVAASHSPRATDPASGLIISVGDKKRSQRSYRI